MQLVRSDVIIRYTPSFPVKSLFVDDFSSFFPPISRTLISFPSSPVFFQIPPPPHPGFTSSSKLPFQQGTVFPGDFPPLPPCQETDQIPFFFPSPPGHGQWGKTFSLFCESPKSSSFSFFPRVIHYFPGPPFSATETFFRSGRWPPPPWEGLSRRSFPPGKDCFSEKIPTKLHILLFFLRFFGRREPLPLPLFVLLFFLFMAT